MTYSAQEQRNLETIRTALESATEDFTIFFRRTFTEQTRWTIAGHGPVSGHYTGLQDLHDHAEAALFDRLAGPLAISVSGLWADGGDVIARIASTGSAIDGELYANEYLYILTMEDDVVTSGIEWLDLHAYYSIVERISL